MKLRKSYEILLMQSFMLECQRIKEQERPDTEVCGGLSIPLTERY